MWNLDYNAGADLDPRVAAEMSGLPAAADGNPHSPHRRGRAALSLLEGARERIAGALGIEAAEVVLTSGGTEANNLAVHSGAAWARAEGGLVWHSPLEHPSVLEPAREAGRGGLGVRALPVGTDGAVGLPETGEAAPAFVSVILAQHEIGVVQDLGPVAARVHAAGGLVHTDATQGLGRLDVAGAVAAADYVTLSPHKAGGPRGIGILVARRGRPVTPVLRGGAQELGRRPGTQSPRLAVGAACAVELAQREWAGRAESMQAALHALLAALPPDRFRVVCGGGSMPLLPNTRTLTFTPVEARHLLPALDLEGILVSHGAACASGAREPSPSLLAVGLSEREAACSVRVSVPPGISTKIVQRAGVLFSQVLARVDALSR